ncbi:hypothetical protein [Paenibacillus sp. KN14-4R]|uniref:hypothetical protein n=1 Tax=Paenibacillus sp. KN14-4R TaxID=3445773 RepID=UPI003F9FE4CE
MQIQTALIGRGKLGRALLAKLLQESSSFDLVYVHVPEDDDGMDSRDEDRTEEAFFTDIDHDSPIHLVFYAGSNAAFQYDDKNRYGYIQLTPERLTSEDNYITVLDSVYMDHPLKSLGSPAVQAIGPLIAALSEHVFIQEAEVVSDIPSSAADAYFREQLDEYITNTERALIHYGGAVQAKSMVFFNPDEEAAVNRYIVHLRIEAIEDTAAITNLLAAKASEMTNYFPGYQLKYAPVYSNSVLTFVIEVQAWSEGLSPSEGHIDLMVTAAIRAGEQLVEQQERGHSDDK